MNRNAYPAADPQSTKDARAIVLPCVGIDSLEVPLRIGGWALSTEVCELPCRIRCAVSLVAEKRGIHMSRMVELLAGWREVVTPGSMPRLLEAVAESQSSRAAELHIAFTWFQQRRSPVSGKTAPQAILTAYHGHLADGTYGYRLRVPVTTLCPCSRDISDYGGHSQRGWIDANLDWPLERPALIPESVVQALSECGSAPIYPLLKRSDERSVTMQAFENPAFVEDVARKAVLALRGLDGIARFSLEARNEESIHTHDAVARFDSDSAAPLSSPGTF